MEENTAGRPPRYYNSVYAIDSQGQIIGATDKVHLVPFGEYVPFEDVLSRFGIENIYGAPGIVIGEIFYVFPHVLMILVTALATADARLYEAKCGGRNRVVGQ
jgi:ABC-type molybdate transport system permease subunit